MEPETVTHITAAGAHAAGQLQWSIIPDTIEQQQVARKKKSGFRLIGISTRSIRQNSLAVIKD
jgi:hypothetical protein